MPHATGKQLHQTREFKSTLNQARVLRSHYCGGLDASKAEVAELFKWERSYVLRKMALKPDADEITQLMFEASRNAYTETISERLIAEKGETTITDPAMIGSRYRQAMAIVDEVDKLIEGNLRKWAR